MRREMRALGLAEDTSSSDELEDRDTDLDCEPINLQEERKKTVATDAAATVIDGTEGDQDASSSDEVDDSDADPDFVPIGLIQKRKQIVSNSDDMIDTSDSENSPHVNESDQRQDLAADDTADDRIESSDVATSVQNKIL